MKYNVTFSMTISVEAETEEEAVEKAFPIFSESEEYDYETEVKENE